MIEMICLINCIAALFWVVSSMRSKKSLEAENNLLLKIGLIEKNPHLCEHFDLDTQQLQTLAISHRGFNYIKNPTYQSCMEAMRNNSYNLKYIKHPSEDLCLEAVSQMSNKYAIEHILANDIPLTDKIITTAIETRPGDLMRLPVEEITEERVALACSRVEQANPKMIHSRLLSHCSPISGEQFEQRKKIESILDKDKVEEDKVEKPKANFAIAFDGVDSTGNKTFGGDVAVPKENMSPDEVLEWTLTHNEFPAAQYKRIVFSAITNLARSSIIRKSRLYIWNLKNGKWVIEYDTHNIFECEFNYSATCHHNGKTTNQVLGIEEPKAEFIICYYTNTDVDKKTRCGSVPPKDNNMSPDEVLESILENTLAPSAYNQITYCIVNKRGPNYVDRSTLYTWFLIDNKWTIKYDDANSKKHKFYKFDSQNHNGKTTNQVLGIEVPKANIVIEVPDKDFVINCNGSNHRGHAKFGTHVAPPRTNMSPDEILKWTLTHNENWTASQHRTISVSKILNPGVAMSARSLLYTWQLKGERWVIEFNHDNAYRCDFEIPSLNDHNYRTTKQVLGCEETETRYFQIGYSGDTFGGNSQARQKFSNPDEVLEWALTHDHAMNAFKYDKVKFSRVNNEPNSSYPNNSLLYTWNLIQDRWRLCYANHATIEKIDTTLVSKHAGKSTAEVLGVEAPRTEFFHVEHTCGSFPIHNEGSFIPRDVLEWTLKGNALNPLDVKEVKLTKKSHGPKGTDGKVSNSENDTLYTWTLSDVGWLINYNIPNMKKHNLTFWDLPPQNCRTTEDILGLDKEPSTIQARIWHTYDEPQERVIDIPAGLSPGQMLQHVLLQDDNTSDINSIKYIGVAKKQELCCWSHTNNYRFNGPIYWSASRACKPGGEGGGYYWDDYDIPMDHITMTGTKFTTEEILAMDFSALSTKQTISDPKSLLIKCYKSEKKSANCIRSHHIASWDQGFCLRPDCALRESLIRIQTEFDLVDVVTNDGDVLYSWKLQPISDNSKHTWRCIHDASIMKKIGLKPNHIETGVDGGLSFVGLTSEEVRLKNKIGMTVEVRVKDSYTVGTMSYTYGETADDILQSCLKQYGDKVQKITAIANGRGKRIELFEWTQDTNYSRGLDPNSKIFWYVKRNDKNIKSLCLPYLKEPSTMQHLTTPEVIAQIV